MAGTRTEYPALLAALQPSQAVNVLNARVRHINQINEDISEWLAERRKIEEAYVASLNRLATRRQEISVDLGVFQASWQSIISGTISLAEAHYGFANRIQNDVEIPLKEQRRDLQSMNSLQTNLASMAKDLEKAQKKGGGASGTAASEWESQAPYVFEQLQGLDENRVNQMREVLTQLQTHAIDCHERSKNSAESALNALLNVDTVEEISAFVAKTSQEVPPPAPPIDELGSRPETSGRSRTSRSERAMTGASLAPSSRRQAEDQRSEVSAHSGDTPKPEKKSKLSGLKRLGTVMGRRKDKEKLDEKPAKGKSRNPLRRNSSSLPQPIPEANDSVPDLPSTAQVQQAPTREEQRPPMIDTVIPTNGPIDHDAGGNLYDSSPQEATAPTINGQPAPPPHTSTAATTMPNNIPQIGIRPPSTVLDEQQKSSVLSDIDRAQQEANAQTHDNDNAFSLNIRDKPIQEESSDQQAAAMANVSNTLRASVVPPPARRTGTLRGRRDVRNTVFVPNPPADPFPPAAPAAATPSAVATGGIIGAAAGATAIGAAAAANAIPPVADVSSPISSPTVGSITSPIIGTITSPIIPSEHRAADAQSIRSMASSLGPGAIKHPDMTAPGLNASIVETSSVTFVNGAISKSVVIGEMAMIHNGSVPAAPSATPHIRLENFPVLEKVAPNPSFVTQITGKSGEYNIDLAQLSRTAVAFKYQIHLDEPQMASYAPVSLSLQHKIEPTQTSVILSYSLNPAFAPPAGTKNTPVALQNVVLILSLEGARASSCQSKPAGVFSREKSLIYWKLGDITLDPSKPNGKLLARFTTESEAKTASVEARWELKGAGSGLGVSIVGSEPAGGNDPFADAGASSTSLDGTKELDVMRRLMAGRYIAS